MEMNGAFSRRILIILCTYATLFLGCIAAAYGKSVEVEWGAGKFTIECYSSTVNSSEKSTDLYWHSVYDGEEKLLYVTRFRGNVTYIGKNPRSGVLNDDGSMTLEADYSSNGKYKCTYRSGNSFEHTLTTVRVVEPPLRVLECNSTSDANHSCRCQVTLPSDKETLTLTFIKAGRLVSNGSLGSLVPVNEAHLPVVSKSNYTRRNDDNSTTISAQYVLNVSELTASDMLQVPFYKTEEECTVEFTKPQLNQVKPDRPVTEISVGIVFGIAALIVIVYFLLRYRKRKESRNNSPRLPPTPL